MEAILRSFRNIVKRQTLLTCLDQDGPPDRLPPLYAVQRPPLPLQPQPLPPHHQRLHQLHHLHLTGGHF